MTFFDLANVSRWDIWGSPDFQQTVLASTLGATIAAFIILALIILIAVYIYFAWAWYTVAKKRGHKHPWLAWIPFANIAMWLQLGGFHWAWVFLLIIPILGWIAVGALFIISNWRVFEKLRYPGWLALSPLLGFIAGGLGTLAYGIVIGFVAWKKKR
ncbi:hypothetical protein J4422_02275 [Candidatus Pacearchaeota archaeon]|nr:hypothetical protein [Candidatus Pacearchaeota archaeon]